MLILQHLSMSRSREREGELFCVRSADAGVLPIKTYRYIHYISHSIKHRSQIKLSRAIYYRRSEVPGTCTCPAWKWNQGFVPWLPEPWEYAVHRCMRLGSNRKVPLICFYPSPPSGASSMSKTVLGSSKKRGIKALYRCPIPVFYLVL